MLDGEELIASMMGISVVLNQCSGTKAKVLFDAISVLARIDREQALSKEEQDGALALVNVLPWYFNFRLALRMHSEGFYLLERRILTEMLKTTPGDDELTLQLAYACFELHDLPCARSGLDSVLNHIHIDLGRLFTVTSEEDQVRALFNNAPGTETTRILRARLLRGGGLTQKLGQ